MNNQEEETSQPSGRRLGKYAIVTISSGVFSVVACVFSIFYSYIASDFGSIGWFFLGAAIALLVNSIIIHISTFLVLAFRLNKIQVEPINL